jgi:hypothetical protein
VRQSLSFGASHPGSEHQEWTENGEDEEGDKAADLKLERQQAFAPVEDATGNQAGEHGALSEQDWAEGVCTLA